MRTCFSVIAFILVLTTGMAQHRGDPFQQYGYYFYFVSINVEWPEKMAEGEFVIGIIGDSPGVEGIKTMASKKDIKGQDIKVRQFENVADIEPCHILYVPREMNDEFKSILEKIGRNHTLVITEDPGMAREGGSLNLMVNDKGVLVFELNKSAFEMAELVPSPVLLRIAANY